MLYPTAIAEVRAASLEEPNGQDHTHKDLFPSSLLQSASQDGLFIPPKFSSSSYLWLELLQFTWWL